MTTTKRQRAGVSVTRHSKWNTKRVYTRRGYLARTYGRQPKRIRFRSRMVNDANQHLCGGWEWYRDGSAATERRLLAGRKPLGSMHYWSKADAMAAAGRLKAAGLRVVTGRGHLPGQWFVDACHDIAVCDLGDLGTLLSDYTAALPAYDTYLADQFARYWNRRLSSFLGRRWDVECTGAPWLTGLILGYPVENTISLYFE